MREMYIDSIIYKLMRLCNNPTILTIQEKMFVTTKNIIIITSKLLQYIVKTRWCNKI